MRNAVANLRKAVFRDSEPAFASLSCVGIHERERPVISFFFHRAGDPAELMLQVSVQYAFADGHECNSAETVGGGICAAGVYGNGTVFFGYTYGFDSVADDISEWLEASSSANRMADAGWFEKLERKLAKKWRDRILGLELGHSRRSREELLWLIQDAAAAFDPRGAFRLERGLQCDKRWKSWDVRYDEGGYSLDDGWQ